MNGWRTNRSTAERGIGANDRAHAFTSFLPPPNRTPGSVMSCDQSKGEPSPKELEKRIKEYLLTAIRALHPLQLDVSLYHIQSENACRDPFGGSDLDVVYALYEQGANECRRLWMKLRALSEKQASLTKSTGGSPPSGSRLGLERSSSPLEYQSALDEDESAETRRDRQVTPMDVDPVEAEPDVPRPLVSTANPLPAKTKPKVRLVHPESSHCWYHYPPRIATDPPCRVSLSPRAVPLDVDSPQFQRVRSCQLRRRASRFLKSPLFFISPKNLS